MDHLVTEVRSSVIEKLKYWLPTRFFSGDVCIYGVPDGLRKVNPLSYTPSLVAIGPLHRDNPQLKPMEELKLRFLQDFLLKTNNVSSYQKMTNLDDIIIFIMGRITLISLFYRREIMTEYKDLCEMMLLDSIFIIQIFLKKESKDPMFDNHWWFRDLMHDFLLIENQIPLYFPYNIYKNHYCQSGGEHNHTDFTTLANTFFKDIDMASVHLPRLPSSISEKPRHFVEYLRMAYFPGVPLPPNPPSQPVSSQLDSTPPLLPLTQKRSNKGGNGKSGVATASRLLECGVKFEVGTSTTTSLVEIQFKPKDGILTIPRIKVNNWTEALFRNLIAFEHCQYLTPRYVTDYIIFMDNLIDTPEDVNILTNKGIIQDDLQHPEKVSELFSNLYKEVITENRHFYFAQLSCELNDYRRDWWHQWKATWYNWMVILRRDYFNSPWSTISFIAAVILLGLTLVQTVCSIYQAKGRKM